MMYSTTRIPKCSLKSGFEYAQQLKNTDEDHKIANLNLVNTLSNTKKIMYQGCTVVDIKQ